MHGCVYRYNPHERYLNPGSGETCGGQTYAAEGHDDDDPYCPSHGGTAAPTSADQAAGSDGL